MIGERLSLVGFIRIFLIGDDLIRGTSLITIPCHKVKGQLISKCPFGVIVWTKISTKDLTNFCPRIWKLWYYKKGPLFCWFLNFLDSRAEVFRWYLLQKMTPKGHFEINWPLVHNRFVLCTSIWRLYVIKIIKSQCTHNFLFYDKTFPNLFTFYFINSMNFNAEFPNLMRILFTARL